MLRRLRAFGRIGLVAAILLIATSGCNDICTLIGCFDGLRLRLVGELPDTLTFMATGEWRHVKVNRPTFLFCPRGATYVVACYYPSTDTVEVLLDIVAPTVKVTAFWGDSTTTYTLHPDWKKVEPNGPGCGRCWTAGETVQFP